jgi:5-oxoprolinase (ATP-hydrolysing) subunit B
MIAAQTSSDLRAQVSMLGTKALLFQAPGAFTLEVQQRIWSLAKIVAAWPDVLEAAPGMTNLLVQFRVSPRDPDALADSIVRTWDACEPMIIAGKILDLPVVYGGDEGPHMADVVACTALSADEVVRRHSAPLYTVYALGSHPGYCYLGGLDDALFVPRREVPLQSIWGGAVSIGGAQTGVSASAGPSGWNTIGRTTFKFFDAAATPPAVLAPGDKIRFQVERVNA